MAAGAATLKVAIEPDLSGFAEKLAGELAGRPVLAGVVERAARELLFEFSEWLDSEGLMRKPAARDRRTHTDLADEFLRRPGR